MKKQISTLAALVTLATGLAACQGGGQEMAMAPGRAPAAAPAPSPMDGRWASADGIFVANFRGGSFQSVDAQTGAVLANGSYTMSGGRAQLDWLSTSSNERRSATCSFQGQARLSCTQSSGASFELQRTA
ncbi:hypothetical protein [Lutibaculum baratangense]|uniref:Outer membrane lipoprotein omp10 n=1 Tax=Lutibaculum baratangense AMV1 TaxID=631454 RepID=V4RKU5_9HYPH|nr:hypothetical protein [Lutibaculum baratangense]ESR25909.1 hypothetical protein N177_1244 [Lutibaculum baratangense AMV1]